MTGRRGVLDAISVTLANGSSQLASVLLFVVIAQLFGATSQTDAFFLALAFSTLVTAPLSGAVSSVLIPLLVERRVHAPESFSIVVGNAVGWVASVSAVASTAVALAAPMFLSVSKHEFITETKWVMTAYVGFLSILVITQAVVAVLTAAYNAVGQFWWPGVAQLLRYGATLALVASLRPIIGVQSLPVGFVFGSVFNVLVMGAGWRGRGLRIPICWRPPPGLEESVRLAAPVLLGTVILQVGQMVFRILASGISPGSVTVFDYANRIGTGVMELLTSGVLLIALAKWSDVAARGDIPALVVKLRDTMLRVLFVIIPVVVLLIVLREPVTVLLLERGKFDHGTAVATASVMGVFVAAIPIDLMSRGYGRVFAARRDTGILAKLAAARVIVASVTAVAIVGSLGVVGLAVADGVGILIALIGAATHARQRLGPTFQGLWLPLFRLVLTSAVAGLVARVVAGHVGSLWSQVVLSTLMGCIAYALVAWLLGIREFFLFLELLPWRRRSPQSA
jgi:putative peptidoglycan lipid II flippase